MLRAFQIVYAAAVAVGVRAQAAGASKWTLGLLMAYSGALMYWLSNSTGPQTVLLALILLADYRVLRWARRCEKLEPPDPVDIAALPREYELCVLIVLRGILATATWIGVLISGALGLALAVLLPPPPAMQISWSFPSWWVAQALPTPTWFVLLSVPACALYHAGFLVFLVPTVPKDKRFSFTKWLEARRAPASTPVKLRVRR